MKPHALRAKRRLLNAIGCKLGEGTKVLSPIWLYGTLKTGKDCFINKNCRINGNGIVEIGDNCDIGPEVTFLTGGHKIGDENRRAGQGESYKITVGEGTWICARSTIVGNVAIGNSCVIAACSCVVKDVTENTLVGGVPAKTIRELQ